MRFLNIFMTTFGITTAVAGLVLLCTGYDFERSVFMILNGLIMTKQDRKIE